MEEKFLDLAYVPLLHQLTIDLQVMALRTIELYLSGFKARPERIKGIKKFLG